MSKLSFRVRKRRPSSSGNLFARLPLVHAQRLHHEALSAAAASLEEPRSLMAAQGVWQVSADSLDFLPLLIEFFESGERIFVSYNGGEVDSHEAVIELPESLLPDPSPDVVYVEALPSIGNADEVHLDPLSSRDWEILQHYADELESRELLQQISVVYPNQLATLQIRGETARVRVLLSDAWSKTQLWPEQDQATNQQYPCLRLVADTEVIIQPKLAKQQQSERLLRLAPCLEEYNEAMQKLGESLGRTTKMIRLNPYTVAVHPRALSLTPGWSDADSRDRLACVQRKTTEEELETAIALVIPSDLVQEDYVVLHPLVRLQLRARLYVDQVSIRIFSHIETNRMVEGLNKYLEKNTLSLVPVKIQSLDLPSWRRPEQWNTTTTLGRATQNVSLDIPSDLDKLPIQVGGLLQLPLSVGFSPKARLFRLAVSTSKTKDNTGKGHPMLCFARDLGRALGSSTESVQEKLEGSEVLALAPSTVLVDTLPPASLVRESLRQHAKRALQDSGVVLYGPLGSGRTHTALFFAAFAGFVSGNSPLYLDCRRLRDSRSVGMRELLNELSIIFEEALEHLPCSLIFDNLDEIIPSDVNEDPQNDSARSQQVNPAIIEQSKVLGDTFCHLLRVLRSKGSVFVIVTCGTRWSIQESVLSLLSLGDPILIPPLHASERDSIFLEHVRRMTHIRAARCNCDVGKRTEGYRPRDIEQLALRVCYRIRRSIMGCLSEASFDEIVSDELNSFIPLTRASASVEDSHAGPSWSQVGGLFRTKQDLFATIIKPSLYRRIYESSQVRLPRGLLLFGEPGCGKSYIVSALAKECDFRLVMCRGAELLDKYIGASEANVRELFMRATSVAPSILFLDEIDALAPRRGSDHTGVTDRIVNQLLTFLDGVEDVSFHEQVFVIAASSRPDKVDPALLRPGRLERHIYVGCPETREETTDLLSKIASGYRVEEEALDQIHSGHFLDRLLKQNSWNPRMTAADIKGAFNTAQVIAAHDALRNRAGADIDRSSVLITSQNLLKAFRESQPSFSFDEYRQLQSIYAPLMGESPLQSNAPVGRNLKTDTNKNKPLRTAFR